jgi:hypothetical protein
MTRQVLAAFFAICSVLLAACATGERQDADQSASDTAFRGRWWSYYERGASFLAKGALDQAESDLARALQGRSTDAWQARTYGLHFVEYFPNRELGIVYFQQGKLDEARTYLTRSLEQIDTARAHEYLDRIVREQIARGEVTDTGAPAIHSSIDNHALLNEPLNPITLEVGDDVAVSRVVVNDRPLYQRGSADSIVFDESLFLTEGRHDVSIRATDIAGKERVTDLSVDVDLTGPSVGVSSPSAGYVTDAATVRVEGAAADVNGVVAIAFTPAPTGPIATLSSPVERAPFAVDFPLAPGANTIVIAATDRAGNETRTAVNVFRGTGESAAARLWQVRETHPDDLLLASTAADLAAVVAATPEASDAPRLVIKSPSAGRPYRHNRTLRVAGEIISTDPIVRLAINGEPITALTGSPQESFNKRLPLDEKDSVAGRTMEITIAAADQAGREINETLQVTLEPVEIQSRQSRMPMAVLAFAAGDPALAADLRTLTEQALVETNRFNMVERQQLEAVLTEQQLSDALGDPNAALQLGKVIPAHGFLVAEVITRGGEAELVGRIISTETSEILATLDAHVADGASISALRAGCAELATQAVQHFPRLSGEVVAIRGNELLLNWTPEDGVRDGMHVLVVHQTEPWVDETTGEVLAPGDVVPIAEGAIQAVQPSGSRAQVMERDAAEGVEIEQGMPAVTM